MPTYTFAFGGFAAPDIDAARAFYRDTLGFEVRNDVGYQGMHWYTVGPAGQPDTSIVLHPPGVDPGITDDERRIGDEELARLEALLAAARARGENR